HTAEFDNFVMFHDYCTLFKILRSGFEITPAFSIASFALGSEKNAFADSTLAASSTTVTMLALSTDWYMFTTLIPPFRRTDSPASKAFLKVAKSFTSTVLITVTLPSAPTLLKA